VLPHPRQSKVMMRWHSQLLLNLWGLKELQRVNLHHSQLPRTRFHKAVLFQTPLLLQQMLQLTKWRLLSLKLWQLEIL
jgi:hypothetical protein